MSMLMTFIAGRTAVRRRTTDDGPCGRVAAAI